MEVVTDLQREEEKLLALLAQQEDFTEEQIAALKEQLPEIEEALDRLKITEEKLQALEREKKNLVEFEAMVDAERKKKESLSEFPVLEEGQCPLTTEEFYRLLKPFPSLLPSPLFQNIPQYKYHGYSTTIKYFIRVCSSSDELLLEMDIEKEYLM